MPVTIQMLLNLKISQGVAPCIQNVPFNIHPESNKQVYNYRGAHCDKRYVDKILPDNSRSNSQSLTYCCANTEYMPFDKMLEVIHKGNLQVINDSFCVQKISFSLKAWLIFCKFAQNQMKM